MQQHPRLAAFLKYAAIYAIIPTVFTAGIVTVFATDTSGAENARLIARQIMDDSSPTVMIKLSKELSEVFSPVGETDELPEGTVEVAYAKTDEPAGIEEAVERIDDSDTEKGLPVIKTALSVNQLFSNQTSYEISPQDFLDAPYPFKGESIGDDPIVLVLHSHATEAFFDSKTADGDLLGYYDDDTPTRSEDITKNVVRVGQVFCDTLTKNGIPNIHSEELHDLNDYNNAYGNAQKTIEKYLKKYPSIRYIVDIHRDSIIRTDGEKIAPTVQINGKDTAQIMIVAGTDESGYSHPNWRSNFSVFFKYKAMTDEAYPGLMRPVNVRKVRFNQHYSSGSMLLEIGSCGSTLASCENAAELAAEQYANLIRRYE